MLSKSETRKANFFVNFFESLKIYGKEVSKKKKFLILCLIK